MKNSNNIDKAFLNYEGALNLFWNGDTKSSLELITEQLSQRSKNSYTVEMYRLWMEILTNDNDDKALKILNDHLLLLSTTDKENSTKLQALRGLIHLELDELTAVRIIIENLKRSKLSLVEELRYSYTTRFESEASFPLTNFKTQDYFELRKHALSCYLNKDAHTLKVVLEYVNSTYDANPLEDEIYFHHYVEVNKLQKATNHIYHLVAIWPDNTANIFKLGFIHHFNGEYELSNKYLNQVTKCDYALNNDVNFLIASNNFKMQNYELAHKQLKQSLKINKNNNKSVNHINDMLENCEDILSSSREGSNQDLKENKMWLVNLNSTESYKIASRSENKVSTISMNIGASAKKDDICFFSTFNKQNESMRIVSIYIVETDSASDPYIKNTSNLRLLSRPKCSIQVDLKFDESKSNNKVYELNDSALDIIRETLKQHKLSSPELFSELAV